jgi:uncharacterized protein (UPF0548 family)
MDVQELPEDEAAKLRSAAHTYEEVGNTAIGPVAGFNWFERSVILQRRDFEGAAQDLLSWQVQARSGLRVSASHTPLQPATVVLMRLGPGPLSLRIPCRVVYLIDEASSMRRLL